MKGACPFYKARQHAEAAQVIIVNHALLISDALRDNHVLPNYQYLIVDEAHQLEDAVTNGLSERLNERDVINRLKELGGLQSGILGDVMAFVRANLPDSEVMRLEDFVQRVSDAGRAAQPYVRKLFMLLYQFIDEYGANNDYRIRIDSRERSHQAFSQVRLHWDVLGDFMESITEALLHLGGAVRRMKDEYDVDELGKYAASIEATAYTLGSAFTYLEHFLVDPLSNYVYWINNASSPKWISLQVAPIHIGPMMEEYIWNKKDAVVLTSATLQTASSFDYLRDRLYADRALEASVGSPFDYRASTLIYVPEDMPMPNERGYQKAVEKGIVDLASALDGRVLALFTSYSQLRETAANIAPRLALGNITVYDQATGGSRESLLDSFKSTEKAVLLGTRSFWEGIDIPGDDLSALVIVRLPFSVPYDPIISARSATYNNSFQEYAVPDAILRFRQGFGRLIRRQSDRGIVAMFDTRVIKKSYGYLFLDSLPDCEIKEGRLDDLADAARRWIDPFDES
jgi:DNA polymerase-3 subunit epsilon/ATP-dependent DNA helicase DinG